MNYKELHKTGESKQLEFKTSFGREVVETVAAFSNASGETILIGVDKNGKVKGVSVNEEILKEWVKRDYVAMHRNKLLAEAFYLRGDIEKFGTGFFRIQSELKNIPEVSFKLESLNGFTRSGLEVSSQDTPQDDLAGISTVKNLLEILTGEMTRQEIQTELKLQDRKYLRKSYLQPALNKGLIEMTLPGKPNSKYQK